MAENVIQSLSKDFVHCAICKEPYNGPKMLPCLHSFCLQCLIPWASNTHVRPLLCPTCRRTVDLPSTGVNGLPDNFFLVSLRERLEEAKQISEQDKDCNCNVCRSKIGTIFCIDCKMHICQDCKGTHNRLTRSNDHPMIPSEKLTDEGYVQEVIATQTPHCKVHKEEKVHYYCTQCSQLACQKCAIVVHQGHQSLHEADSVVTSAMARLSALLRENLSNTETARKNLKVTKEATREIERHISDLLGKVDDRYNEIVTKLKSDKKKLTEKLQGIQEKECAPIKRIEANICEWLGALEYTREMTTTVLDQNISWDILEMKSKLANSLESLNKTNKKEMYFPSRLRSGFNGVKAKPHKTKRWIEDSADSLEIETSESQSTLYVLPESPRFQFYPAKIGDIDEYEKRKSFESNQKKQECSPSMLELDVCRSPSGKTVDGRQCRQFGEGIQYPFHSNQQKQLFNDNFIGDIASNGYLPRKWLV